MTVELSADTGLFIVEPLSRLTVAFVNCKSPEPRFDETLIVDPLTVTFPNNPLLSAENRVVPPPFILSVVLDVLEIGVSRIVVEPAVVLNVDVPTIEIKAADTVCVPLSFEIVAPLSTETPPVTVAKLLTVVPLEVTSVEFPLIVIFIPKSSISVANETDLFGTLVILENVPATEPHVIIRKVTPVGG